MSFIDLIKRSSINIYNYIEDCPDEKYYQSYLNVELQDLGYIAQNEVNLTYTYKTISNNMYSIPDRLHGRIDILLEKEKLIIETKSIKKQCNMVEISQLRRYMREYFNNKWGNNTKGMLINFGDKELEIFYMYYNEQNEIICEKIHKENKKNDLINIIDKTLD